MKPLFRFVILGDGYRGNKETSPKVLRTLLTNIKSLSPQPDFIFGLGDMVDGSSNVRKELEIWKTIIEEFYPITMFYPTIGNHEEDEGAFSNAFSHLPSEQLPGYKRTTYYFDHGDVRFIVLNSIRFCKSGSYAIDAKQRKWLDSVLSNSEKKYHFVMFHVPAFPTGSHYGESLDGNLEERNAFWKILDHHDVTGVFVGHEHNYCRRLINKSFHDIGIPIKNSIYHITVGGAGASLSSGTVDNKNILNGPLAVHHYVVIDIFRDDVILQTYDMVNELIDSCSLKSTDNGSSINYGTDILIPLGAEWRYLDNGTDQGRIWCAAEFDDSSWKSGPAELGYGDGGEATIVSYGPDSHRKYITTYFRKSFTIKDVSLYKNLTIKIQRDDGAVVYINGNEVYRTNMPSGDINFRTPASKALRGLDEITFEKITIDAGVLTTGENIVSVEIHQASSSSSDISFNLQLLGHKE